MDTVVTARKGWPHDCSLEASAQSIRGPRPASAKSQFDGPLLNLSADAIADLPSIPSGDVRLHGVVESIRRIAGSRSKGVDPCWTRSFGSHARGPALAAGVRLEAVLRYISEFDIRFMSCCHSSVRNCWYGARRSREDVSAVPRTPNVGWVR